MVAALKAVCLDQTRYVFDKVTKWARLNDEFGKRSAFALLATARWVGKDGLNALTGPATLKRLKR